MAVHSGRFEAWASTRGIESLDAPLRVAGLSPDGVVPLFADQPYNARAVEEAGTGVAVLRPEAAPVRAAIQRVLNDSSLHSGAPRIAAGMSTMASMDDAAGALLALAHARTF